VNPEKSGFERYQKMGMKIIQANYFGGGGGSRTRVRKCYWSRDYMLIPVHAPGVCHLAAGPPGRSRRALRTDKKRSPLACNLSPSPQT